MRHIENECQIYFAGFTWKKTSLSTGFQKRQWLFNRYNFGIQQCTTFFYKEFYNYLGKTGQKPTTASVGAFLKTKGVSDALIKQYVVASPGSVAKYPGEVIDKTEAAKRLQGELEIHAGSVDSAARHANMPLTAGQRDALISYSYNAGAGRMRNIINQVNGDPNKLSSAIGNGVRRASGQVLPGLVERRSQEARLASS